MKKLLIALTLFFLSLSIAYSVSAVTTVPQAKPVQQWHCLQTAHCSDPGTNCGTGPSVVPGHRVLLNTKVGDLPTRNAQTTPFVCVATQEGNICTSGDDDWDLLTVGYRGLSRLKTLTSYEFQGLFGTRGTTKVSARDIYANDQGKLSIIAKQSRNFQLIPEVLAVATMGNKYQLVEPLEMQDYTPVSHLRKWVALNLIAPQQIEMGQGGEQQGTFTFAGALARCASIAWDPYGIVFDSQSLEPVMGIQVSLLKQRDNGQFTLASGEDVVSILNPVTTVEDGAFEFYVPNGTYRLGLKAPNFIFPSIAKLNPNYSKIYSDVYHGENIVEQGVTQHRDVPIDSKTTPYHSAVKVIDYFPLLDKETNSFVMQGRVSHPLTTINVYGKKPSGSGFVRTKLLATYTADKVGNFKIDYNLNQLAATEVVGDIEFIKPDYNNLTNSTETAATKKSAVLSIDPIPNYLEGYAYDKNGKPLVNATVGVYLNASNKSAYETTTDQNGFYRISSEYLPAMSYGIKYITTGGVSVPVSTSDFIAQNAKYLETQRTNLFAFKNKNGQVFTATVRNKFSGTTGTNGTPGTTGEPNLMVQSNTQAALLPIILILAILGIGSLGVIMYFMKKK